MRPENRFKSGQWQARGESNGRNKTYIDQIMTGIVAINVDSIASSVIPIGDLVVLGLAVGVLAFVVIKALAFDACLIHSLSSEQL